MNTYDDRAISEQTTVVPSNGYPPVVAPIQERPTIFELSEGSAEIFHSKTFVGQNSRIRYDSPEIMLEPVIAALAALAERSSIDITIDASNPVTNRNDDQSENTAYGRVRLESRLELGLPVAANGHSEVLHETIGFIYAFDLGKPEVIVYNGTRVRSCLNLQIFGSRNVRKFDYAQDGVESAHAMIAELARDAELEQQRQARIIEGLMNERWTANQLARNIGHTLKHVTLKNTFGQAALVAAVRDLNTSGHRYEVQSDGSTTAWNFLQALTQYVTDKSHFNVAPVKTVQMSDFVLALSQN